MMRKAIGVAVALLWATAASSQTPPDTFKAGIGEYMSPFFVGPNVDSGKVAILLPADVPGRMIFSVRAYFAPPNGGPVPHEQWVEYAAFTWGLWRGTKSEPLYPTGDLANVELKSNPDVRIGGFVETQVEWPAMLGNNYWLIGYWQEDAEFIRLGRNQLDLQCALRIGYRESNLQVWQEWYSSGFVLEVTYGTPNQGVPAGIFDSESDPDDRPITIHAGISSDGLTVTLNSSHRSHESYSPYTLLVVNTLGQTVVSEAGIADFEQIRIPWSAHRPSGVYFCRIRLGRESYTVPVVNLK